LAIETAACVPTWWQLPTKGHEQISGWARTDTQIRCVMGEHWPSKGKQLLRFYRQTRRGLDVVSGWRKERKDTWILAAIRFEGSSNWQLL
jgi:hypothetical protein